MPSLKAIRKRIASVKNTQKITKAMKMVAAAKLRRAQDAVQAIRPYATHLGQIANELAERLLAEPTNDAAGLSGEELTEEQKQQRLVQRILLGATEKRVRVVVVAADRGLAGAYNSNLFRRVEKLAVEHPDKTLELFLLGKKARDYFRRRPFKVVKDLPGVDPKTCAARAKDVAAQLTAALLNDETDAIYIVYNEFKSAAVQAVRVDRLLPLRLKPVRSGAAGAAPADDDDQPRTLIDFEYEPDRKSVLLHLLPLYLETELRRVMLEAVASEFGSRMRAMENASRNAKEMIGRLTLTYNRARQAAITKELMEIIGGAEALKG